MESSHLHFYCKLAGGIFKVVRKSFILLLLQRRTWKKIKTQQKWKNITQFCFINKIHFCLWEMRHLQFLSWSGIVRQTNTLRVSFSGSFGILWIQCLWSGGYGAKFVTKCVGKQHPGSCETKAAQSGRCWSLAKRSVITRQPRVPKLAHCEEWAPGDCSFSQRVQTPC